jgi:hypothetical protein
MIRRLATLAALWMLVRAWVLIVRLLRIAGKQGEVNETLYVRLRTAERASFDALRVTAGLARLLGEYADHQHRQAVKETGV